MHHSSVKSRTSLRLFPLSYVASFSLLFALACGTTTVRQTAQSPNTAPTGQTPGTSGPRGATGPSGASQPGTNVTPYFPEKGIEGGGRVAFTISPADFSSAPFPSELWRTAEGKLSLTGYPAADHFLGSVYVDAIERDADGFSVAPAVYFKFDVEPDLTQLSPNPGDTSRLQHPIAMLDVDDTSPDKGELIPITFKWYPTGDGKFIGANTLAVKPVAGFVLRANTTYAVVVMRSLSTRSGALLGTTDDFEYVKWTEAREPEAQERQRKIHFPVFNYLAELGLGRADIAAAAVFKTANPYAAFDRLFAHATSLTGPNKPRIVSAAQTADGGNYREVTGYYCTPNYQSDLDLAPFQQSGGKILFGTDGQPVLQDVSTTTYADADCGKLLKARFVLTVPKTTMPAGGWPLIESAHGTGGSARSELGTNKLAGLAAAVGIATVMTDQPLHGTKDDPGERPGANQNVSLTIPGLPIGIPLKSAELFYNPMNPVAGRDNARQAAIDAIVLGRLMTEAPFVATGGPGEVTFNREKLMAFGHSQGSQTNAPIAVVDPSYQGIVLSGAGGDIRYGILYRSSPKFPLNMSLRTILSAALGISEGMLDEFHPVMALVQHVADSVDPQTWARLYREPLPGRAPQNVLLYEGIKDTYNPPSASEALAVALHATPVRPAVVNSVLGLSLRGIDPVDSPLSANIAAGQATCGLIQFDSTQGEDGHFVIYQEPTAFDWAINFYESVLAEAVPNILAP